MSFEYQPYRSPYANSIAQLMLQRGDIGAQQAQAIGQAQARAAEQSGQAWAGAAQNIGQAISQIPQQLQQQRMQGLQTQNLQSEIADRDAKAKQVINAQKASAAVDQIMAQSLKEDPQTGVKTFDRQAFEQGLLKSGNGHLYPQLAETLDKLDASAAKRNAEGRTMLAESLMGIGKAGYTPESVMTAAAYLKANSVITSEHLAPVLAAVTQDPSPENIKRIVSQLGNAIPEFGKLQDAEQSRVAGLAKTTAETAKSTAEAAKVQAEVAGTLPLNPAQVETARHNKEIERIDALKVGREAAAQAETARHNKATEAANNPLAALGGPQATAAPGAKLTGEEFLKTLPENVAGEVKAYAEGRRPFPAGFALKSPYFQSLIQMVGQYDPSFDAVNYNARAKTRADFTSGKAAGQVNALNTVIGHLDKLSDAAEALNNTDVPMLNSALNALSKSVGRPNVTNFNTIKKAVADEVTRVWRQSGGSVEDIRTAQENLSAANSPDQLRGAIATYGELLNSKLGSLQDQYKQGMGTDAISMLRPDSQQVLDKIAQRATGGQPQTAKASTAKVGDIKYLPNGDKVQITFIDPKGNATVKKVP